MLVSMGILDLNPMDLNIGVLWAERIARAETQKSVIAQVRECVNHKSTLGKRKEQGTS